jgi:hypothetical protein
MNDWTKDKNFGKKNNLAMPVVEGSEIYFENYFIQS